MIELTITQRRRNLGSFEVGRLLPFAERRMVGPFIFFDHMGPVYLPKGLARKADVLPHPHIGLSTVTYLFEGEIIHRDSTGVEQPIELSMQREQIKIQVVKSRLEGGDVAYIRLTSFNEQTDAGSYTRNFQNELLASGVYFYKISAGSFNAIRKMVLIR